MKFTMTFKTPDVFDTIGQNNPETLEEERDTFAAFAEQFISYGEQVSIEFDTEAGTATVLKVRP